MQTAPVQPAPVQTAPNTPSTAVAARSFQLVNEYRAANGVAALRYNSALETVAQTWSTTMKTNVEAHGSAGFYHNPDLAAQIPAHWRMYAENIAVNADADALFAAWKASPGHNANMLHPGLTDFGFGSAVLSAGPAFGAQVAAAQDSARYDG